MKVPTCPSHVQLPLIFFYPKPERSELPPPHCSECAGVGGVVIHSYSFFSNAGAGQVRSAHWTVLTSHPHPVGHHQPRFRRNFGRLPLLQQRTPARQQQRSMGVRRVQLQGLQGQTSGSLFGLSRWRKDGAGAQNGPEVRCLWSEPNGKNRTTMQVKQESGAVHVHQPRWCLKNGIPCSPAWV